MDHLQNILEGFDPISLKQMEAVMLQDRLDFKFVFHRDKLPGILEQLKESYSVLSINGKRSSGYDTRYLDTPDLKMYIQHHNGKLNRYKVRFREYVDSGTRFFEIKFKTNQLRTIKDRVSLNETGYAIRGEAADLLRTKTGYEAGMLSESLQVNYTRITLVQKNQEERLTLDTGLTFINGQKKKSFPQLVIAEVKQARQSSSFFTRLMREQSIQNFTLSKYCLGIACLNDTVKTNNFKPKLLYVKKLCNNHA